MSDGGKGSSPRPYSVSKDEFSANWDRIFRKDLKKEDDEKAEAEELEIIQQQQKINGSK